MNECEQVYIYILGFHSRIASWTATHLHTHTYVRRWTLPVFLIFFSPTKARGLQLLANSYQIRFACLPVAAGALFPFFLSHSQCFVVPFFWCVIVASGVSCFMYMKYSWCRICSMWPIPMATFSASWIYFSNIFTFNVRILGWYLTELLATPSDPYFQVRGMNVAQKLDSELSYEFLYVCEVSKILHADFLQANPKSQLSDGYIHLESWQTWSICEIGDWRLSLVYIPSSKRSCCSSYSFSPLVVIVHFSSFLVILYVAESCYKISGFTFSFLFCSFCFSCVRMWLLQNDCTMSHLISFEADMRNETPFLVVNEFISFYYIVHLICSVHRRLVLLSFLINKNNLRMEFGW